MKKVIQNLVYTSIKDLENGSCDLGMVVNGKDLIDLPLAESIEILNKYYLIDEGNVIIPMGFKLVETKIHGSAEEYIFQGDDITISVDLSIDDEEQYIA